MSYFEFTGKTVEDAVEEGLKVLKLSREEVEYVVLEEGRQKLFGTKAKIKMCKKRSDGERAIEFLDGLFDIMKINASNELVRENDEIEINIITTNTYSVIGHRGEVLDSLQCLAGAVANTGREDYKRVVVDCESYRNKREDTLKKLAEKLAEKAIRTGRKVTLEPMNPYERRVIHSAVSSNTEVKTQSEGKEPNRYVVFIPNNMKKFDKNFKGNKNFNKGDKKHFNKENKHSFNKDRRDKRDGQKHSNTQSRPTEKRPVYFGTFLGNSKDKE